MKKNKRIIFLSIVSAVILGVFVTSVNANSDIIMQRNIQLNGNSTIDIKFKERYSTKDNSQIHVYEDVNNNQYFYKNNKLVGYFNENYYSSENVLSRESKESIGELNQSNEKNLKENEVLDKEANKYLEYFTSENLTKSSNKYELISKTFLDATDEYSYLYAKKIDGFLVNDGIIISLDKDGNLISYSGAQQGEYDKYNDIKIDKESLNNYIIKETARLGIEKYEIDKQFINIVNNKLVLQIGIKIIHENGALSTTVLYYNI